MLLIMTGWISLYKIGWEDFFKLIFFKILDYLHLYNKYLGMGLKSTHKIHLYFIEPSNTYLKVIIYSIFFLAILCMKQGFILWDFQPVVFCWCSNNFRFWMLGLGILNRFILIRFKAGQMETLWLSLNILPSNYQNWN